jgi:hypothetical protein
MSCESLQTGYICFDLSLSIKAGHEAFSLKKYICFDLCFYQLGKWYIMHPCLFLPFFFKNLTNGCNHLSNLL